MKKFLKSSFSFKKGMIVDMTKEESLYQVKLIIDCLSDEEYDKIDKKTIKYIEENMVCSDAVKFNPDVPLEEQEIDEKTYDFLEQILKAIDGKASNVSSDLDSSISGEDELDKEKLIELVEKYKKENSKLPKAKELLDEYKEILEKKNAEIDELKKINQDLYNSIQKCPRLFRKILFKNFDNKLLK